MSTFLLLIRVDDTIEPAPEDADPTAWWEGANARGMYLGGGPLQGTSDATTVRLRDDQTLITDGPFAEYKEHIAGYDLIEAADLAEAVDLAKGHPVTRFGAIEVREVWQDWLPANLAGKEPTVAPKPAGDGRRYLMLHEEQGARPDETAQPAGEGLGEWLAEMQPRGVLVTGDRLRTSSEAATVRVRAGETLVTHGPYAELAEQVGGFDLIEVADLDEAIDVASKHPTLWASAIEIRPLGTL